MRDPFDSAATVNTWYGVASGTWGMLSLDGGNPVRHRLRKTFGTQQPPELTEDDATFTDGNWRFTVPRADVIVQRTCGMRGWNEFGI